MPEQSARLGIPLPLGNENVSRQAIREMLQAVDDHAETIPGAQAKADAAEAAAKFYADSAAGSAAEAVASALAAHKADFTQQIPYAVTAGSANAYTASTIPALPALVAGVAIAVKIHAANTGAATLNWNAKGAKSIRNPDGTAVASGDLASGGVYTLRYDGTNFILQGKGEVKLTGDAVAANVLSGKTFYSTDPKTKLTGTMANNASQTTTMQIADSTKPTKAIPAGYTPGGTITVELAATLASKIVKGNTIGGVAGTFVQAYPSGNQSWTTAGTYTWTVPTDVKKITALVTGGGGGGGGSDSYAGGGGAGGFSAKVLSVTPGQVLTIVVGAGGAVGLPYESGPGWSHPPYPGDPGGKSEIVDLITAGGGGGGQCDSNSYYAVGGGGGTYEGYGASGHSGAQGVSGESSGSGGRGVGGGHGGKGKTGNGSAGRVLITW